jgi:hypothetical protein
MFRFVWFAYTFLTVPLQYILSDIHLLVDFGILVVELVSFSYKGGYLHHNDFEEYYLQYKQNCYGSEVDLDGSHYLIRLSDVFCCCFVLLINI